MGSPCGNEGRGGDAEAGESCHLSIDHSPVEAIVSEHIDLESHVDRDKEESKEEGKILIDLDRAIFPEALLQTPCSVNMEENPDKEEGREEEKVALSEGSLVSVCFVEDQSLNRPNQHREAEGK